MLFSCQCRSAKIDLEYLISSFSCHSPFWLWHSNSSIACTVVDAHIFLACGISLLTATTYCLPCHRRYQLVSHFILHLILFLFTLVKASLLPVRDIACSSILAELIILLHLASDVSMKKKSALGGTRDHFH
jgi:hypothetical protein